MKKCYSVFKYVLRKIDGENIILIPKTGSMFSLSEPAINVLKFIENKKTANHGEILQFLAEYYDADINTLADDLKIFIDFLVENDIIEEL